MNSIETILGHKLLYLGISHNWMGDRILHVVIGVTPGLALSICGPAHRADAIYGLPDVKDDRYDSGIMDMIQALVAGRDVGYPDLSICVLKRLTPEEYPMVPEHRSTGLRTLVCSCNGVPDQYTMVPATSVLHYLEVVKTNADTATVSDTRTVNHYTNMQKLRDWGTIVYLDPTHDCWADPHPVKKPYDYVLANIRMSALAPAERILGVYVWTDMDHHCHDVTVVDAGTRLKVMCHDLDHEWCDRDMARLRESFKKFYAEIRRKYVADRSGVKKRAKTGKKDGVRNSKGRTRPGVQ